MRIIVAGGGKMGEAFVSGLLRREEDSPEEILIVEVDPERRNYLERTYATTAVVAELPPREDSARYDVLLVAVKPADLEGLLASASERVPPTVVVLSIAAGVRIASIRNRLGSDYKVVRAMPNLGATVGAGVSAYAVGPGVGEEERALARRILEAVGPAIEVPERELNAVTALSGSGPAYVFLLAEAMEEAARELGMSRREAELLIAHTVLGAGLLLVEAGPLAEGGRSAADWRKAVTSKGGTTEAALAVLERRGFVDSVVEAVKAAATRAAELDTLGGGC